MTRKNTKKVPATTASKRQPLTDTILFRVRPEEKTTIQARADERGLKISTYCRNLVLRRTMSLGCEREGDDMTTAAREQTGQKFDKFYHDFARMAKIVEDGIQRLESGGKPELVIPSIERTMQSILAQFTKMNELLSPNIKKKPRRTIQGKTTGDSKIIETLTLEL